MSENLEKNKILFFHFKNILKKIKFFLLQINIFLMFLYYFNMLILKLIFKK
jgi:hypothetical protein